MWVCCWLWTLCHTTQHGAVLIIFPLNLQTITITRMLSSGGEGRISGGISMKLITVTQYQICMTLVTVRKSRSNHRGHRKCCEIDNSGIWTKTYRNTSIVGPRTDSVFQVMGTKIKATENIFQKYSQKHRRHTHRRFAVVCCLGGEWRCLYTSRSI